MGLLQPLVMRLLLATNGAPPFCLACLLCAAAVLTPSCLPPRPAPPAATVGVITETNAEKAIEELKAYEADVATALRGGRWTVLPAAGGRRSRRMGLHLGGMRGHGAFGVPCLGASARHGGSA